MSLHVRLLTAMLAVIMAVGGATLYFSYNDAQDEIEELFDAEMAQFARALISIIAPQIGHRDVKEIQAEIDQLPQFQSDSFSGKESNAYGHAYEKKIAFQFLDRDQNVILRSTNAPIIPMHHGGAQGNEGFNNSNFNLHQWRVFSLWDISSQYQVQVAERNDVRNELATLISKRLLTPSLISLPIISLLVWLAIGRGLAPLPELVRQVFMRDPNNLSPLSGGNTPREIKPLIAVLNKLFSQLKNAIESERRFTGNAAHELRTPLAAIKTQAQVALRAIDENKKNEALIQVIKGVNRSSHLLEQMLTLARLDFDISEPQQASNFKEVLLNVTNDLSMVTARRQIRIQYQDEICDFFTSVNAYHLQILLRNLLENAIQYSPERSLVTLKIYTHNNKATVNVIDQGSGVAEDEITQIFDRFYRGNKSNVEGCGLGLSIVKLICELYGLDLNVANVKPNGFCVSFTIPVIVKVELVRMDKSIRTE